MCRWNGCHKFQRLDIDAWLILSGFREVGASHILKSWSYESPKQKYFRLKLMINKWGKPSIGPTWRHTGASGNVTVYYFISEVPQFYWEGARAGVGGALAILCVPGMCRPQGYVFHNFCLGRVLFLAQQSGKGRGFCLGRVLFSGPIVWQGVCFDPGLIPRVASVNKRLARR